MITAIVLSKDRPAQLDLLLRSLDRNGGGQFHVIVEDAITNFETRIRQRLGMAGALICFMCDDGILYRPVRTVSLDHDVLCFSLRLGTNTTTCYPSGLEQPLPHWHGLTRHGNAEIVRYMWAWTKEPRDPGVSDFGYPGSIDGHIFRKTDLLRILDGKRFPNPTALECALVAGCDELAAERPLMACYPHSVYVGNPVNRVSEQSNVRYGTRFPASVEECRARFLAGERIDLDAMDFTAVDGAHSEVELVWK